MISSDPRFLIVRLSAIGDCLETLPVVHAIKDAYPKAWIGWIVDCGSDQLLRNQHGIDQVLRVKKGFLFRSSERRALLQQIRNWKIDVAIDPQGLFKSSILTWLSGAKMRIGFDAQGSRECAWWFYSHRVHSEHSHLVDRQIDLLRPLKIESPAIRFDFSVDRDADLESTRLLGSLGLMDRPYLAINPGASTWLRRWPSERFKEVVERVFEAEGIPSLVIWGGREEEGLADNIVNSSRHGCAIKAPSSTLQQLAGWLKRASVVVTGDTGPMHLAVALGTPVVGIFGPTLPSKSGPYGPAHISLRNESETQVKILRKQKTNESICKVTVEEVVAACLQQIRKLRAVQQAS